jgi:5'-deoxynucleotidase YfbR-like HD superfamily hydrolase
MVDQTNSCIAIVGGTFVDLSDPSTAEYDINAIAHALARVNRYTGHIETDAYSVAEHCVHVSNAIDQRYAYEGLMHDAAEAFVGDVSSPLKQMLGRTFRDIEDAFHVELAKRFGFQFPYPSEVHDADKRVYWAERATVAPGPDKLWHQEYRSSRKVTPEGWDARTATARFLERFEELYAMRHGEVSREVA